MLFCSGLPLTYLPGVMTKPPPMLLSGAVLRSIEIGFMSVELYFSVRMVSGLSCGLWAGLTALRETPGLLVLR